MSKETAAKHKVIVIGLDAEVKGSSDAALLAIDEESPDYGVIRPDFFDKDVTDIDITK